jgi:hypothetical protein
MFCNEQILSVNDPCLLQTSKGVYDITDCVGFNWAKISNSINTSEFQKVVSLRDNAITKVLSKLKTSATKTGYFIESKVLEEKASEFSSTAITVTSGQTNYFSSNNYFSCKSFYFKTSESYANMDIIISYYDVNNILQSITINLTSVSSNVVQNISFAEIRTKQIFFEWGGTYKVFRDSFKGCSCSGGKPVSKCGKITAGTFVSGSYAQTSQEFGNGIIPQINCSCELNTIICDLPDKTQFAELVKKELEISILEIICNSTKYSFLIGQPFAEARVSLFDAKQEIENLYKSYMETILNDLSKVSTCVICRKGKITKF